MTRREAFALKLVRFESGVPCLRGHLSERYTETNSCLQCRADKRKTVRMEKIALGMLRPKCVPTPEPRRAGMARREAFARGLIKFDSGKSCHRGHFGMRYTKSNACIECRTWLRDSVKKQQAKSESEFRMVRRKIRGVPVMVRRFVVK